MSKIKQAIALLQDQNLIWSDDFETIREPLADYLIDLNTHGDGADIALEPLLDKLLQTEVTEAGYDDPLMEWIESATRQLGIVEYTASRSERMAAALKKLFRSL